MKLGQSIVKPLSWIIGATSLSFLLALATPVYAEDFFIGFHANVTDKNAIELSTAKNSAVISTLKLDYQGKTGDLVLGYNEGPLRLYLLHRLNDRYQKTVNKDLGISYVVQNPEDSLNLDFMVYESMEYPVELFMGFYYAAQKTKIVRYKGQKSDAKLYTKVVGVNFGFVGYVSPLITFEGGFKRDIKTVKKHSKPKKSFLGAFDVKDEGYQVYLGMNFYF